MPIVAVAFGTPSCRFCRTPDITWADEGDRPVQGQSPGIFVASPSAGQSSFGRSYWGKSGGSGGISSLHQWTAAPERGGRFVPIIGNPSTANVIRSVKRGIRVDKFRGLPVQCRYSVELIKHCLVIKYGPFKSIAERQPSGCRILNTFTQPDIFLMRATFYLQLSDQLGSSDDVSETIFSLIMHTYFDCIEASRILISDRSSWKSECCWTCL